MKERKTKQGKRHFQKVCFLPKSPNLAHGRWEQWRDLGKTFHFRTFVLDTERTVQIPLPGRAAACLLWSMRSANSLQLFWLRPGCGGLTSLVSIRCW